MVRVVLQDGGKKVDIYKKNKLFILFNIIIIIDYYIK
jgi:hypothetical protein